MAFVTVLHVLNARVVEVSHFPRMSLFRKRPMFTFNQNVLNIFLSLTLYSTFSCLDHRNDELSAQLFAGGIEDYVGTRVRMRFGWRVSLLKRLKPNRCLRQFYPCVLT